MAGLVPATPLNVARPCPVIGVAGTSPAMTVSIKLYGRRRTRLKPSKGSATAPYPAQAWASTTATAVMLTMPRAVTDGVRMCAGLAVPIRIGPTASASAMVLIAS
jgi:hypothetical protein